MCPGGLSFHLVSNPSISFENRCKTDRILCLAIGCVIVMMAIAAAVVVLSLKKNSPEDLYFSKSNP